MRFYQIVTFITIILDLPLWKAPDEELTRRLERLAKRAAALGAIAGEAEFSLPTVS